jgi:KRAB domain-containing zinc finger protein
VQRNRFPRSPTARSPGFGGVSERDKHICPICKKPFPNQSSLNKHLTSHSDDRPYECTECFKKFKRLDHLNSHALTHKGTSFT